MPYIATDSAGLGFIEEVASAAGSVIGGAIDLSTNIGLWRQQRRDAAAYREDAWAAEFGEMQYDRLLAMQNAEVLATQNAIADERARLIEEQERVVGLERVALQAQIRRDQLQADRRAREEAAMRLKMPMWGWFALAGVGISVVVGAGAFAGARSAGD